MPLDQTQTDLIEDKKEERITDLQKLNVNYVPVTKTRCCTIFWRANFVLINNFIFNHKTII